MYIAHYGVKRRSGRYPWGSGEDPEQRGTSFLGYVDELKKQGLSEVEIARNVGMTTKELREKKSLEKEAVKQAEYTSAVRMKDKGMSNVAIGERLGRNESYVRKLLAPSSMDKVLVTNSTVAMLKDNVDSRGYIDIGLGVESHLGISGAKLNTAVSKLVNEEGYVVQKIQVDQLGTNKKTTIKVLAPPGTTYVDVVKNKDNIHMVGHYSEDGGRSFLGVKPPVNINSKRIDVRYADDPISGTDRDGLIELRRGVGDISLGNSLYAQVRIAVDGTHYLKGMAMYADDLPDGVDIRFNTNKDRKPDKKACMKKLSDDPDNPFGAVVRQKTYVDEKGKEHQSALNIVNEEGVWGTWSKSLPSQVLSKQPVSLAKEQLGLALKQKQEDYNEIMALTNPAVKQKLLKSFSDGADAASVHMKGAALPRTATHVILPFPTLKDNECFAPNYRDGETLALIRFPHGGKFEIPEVVVNNKNKEARQAIAGAKDAIGINPKVAAQLSGADFDGDFVLAIPNNNKKIKNANPLDGLKDFDHQRLYKKHPGMKPMTLDQRNMEMGNISNLITDMTIKGAGMDEICRAVKHSMVVIDAYKHELDFRQSAIDNGITELKKKYQGVYKGRLKGASTIVSKATSEARVGVRKESIDPKTGKKVYEYSNESYIDKNGKEVLRTIKSKKMLEVDDAHELSSGYEIESVYADHANGLKSLANNARKEMVNMKMIPYSSSARTTYANEVSSLKAKLNTALKNKPLERQAQLTANKIVAAKRESNPNMDPDTLKKIKGQALEEARRRNSAKKQAIDITEREWEAIQAGAVSTNTLKQILDNTPDEVIKSLATPRAAMVIPQAKIDKAKRLSKKGVSQADIADALGLTTSQVNKIL